MRKMEQPVNERQIRGYQIFRTQRIVKHPKKHGWIVPSQTTAKSKKYFVSEDFICNCPDSEQNGITCKHAYAARYYLDIEDDVPVDKIENPTYPQAWSAYNLAQMNEVLFFDQLLHDLVEDIPDPIQCGRGRPQASLRDVVFCSVQKVYSQLSTRRAFSLFRKAYEYDQIEHVPHFNTVIKFLNREDLTPLLERLISLTARPLQEIETEFAIDSSGFRTTTFNEYHEHKHSVRREHHWLKVHICTGVRTNIITGIEISHNEHAGDSPQFQPLIEQTASDGFNVREVSADAAYSSRKNYEVVKELGGQAYIPFKSHATPTHRGSRLWRKMLAYFQYHKEEFMSHYHKRSNVETTFFMLKTKFGDKLKTRNPVAQTNELLCKAIAHNIVVLIHEMMELGITPEFTEKQDNGMMV